MNRQITIAVIAALVVGLSCGAAATWSWLRAPQGATGGISGDQHDDDHEGDEHAEQEDNEDEHGNAVRLTQKQMDELGIEVGAARSGSLRFSVSLPGEVVLNPDRTAHIVPRAPGIVREVLKNVGDLVRAGDVMAWIESAELSEAKVDYLAKSAELSCCTVDLTRAQEVHDNTIRLLEMLTSAPSMETLREMNGVAMGDNRSALVSAYAEFIFSKTTYMRERALLEKRVSSEEDYQAAEAAHKKADALYAATRDSIAFKIGRDLLEAKRSQHVREMELKGAERRLYVLGLASDDIRELELLAQSQATPLAKKAECNDPNCKDCAKSDSEARRITGADLTKTAEKLAWYSLRAPFDGTVIEKHLTLGEKHGDDSLAFTVADLSNVWVNLTVYQKDLVLVRAGQPVTISFGHGIPNMGATIDYVSPLVDEETRTATARVVLDNSEGHYRPGLFVTAEVQVDEKQVLVLVPKEALQTMDGRSVVFVENDEGFELRPVTVGRSDDTNVEITAGLEPGERYVTANAFTLKSELAKAGFEAGHGH